VAELPDGYPLTDAQLRPPPGGCVADVPADAKRALDAFYDHAEPDGEPVPDGAELA
jgi:hypothetical protein